MRAVGILGGMGPAATVAFLARVQALTPAELAQMGAIYRRLYRQADVLNSLNVPLGKRRMSGG